MNVKTRNPEQVVKTINSLLDRLVCIAPVVLKTCQYRISAEGDRITRAGRFAFIASEHDDLVTQGGYYLFVVLKYIGTPIIWISPAAEVPFFHQLSWTVALKTKKAHKKDAVFDAAADKVLSEYLTKPSESPTVITL